MTQTAQALSNISLKDIPAILPLLSVAEQEKLLAELEKLHDLKTQNLAQSKFLAFVKSVWPTFISGRHHAKMAAAFERVAEGKTKRLIINMPPRHRLALHTPVPTTDGWKTVATVNVGDYVFGVNGEPVLVTGKSAVVMEDLYEVVTSDGQSIHCDGDHLWTVRFGSHQFVTLSTAEILHKLETETWRNFGNLPVLPPYEAAKFPRKHLPVDPYVLGVWLGDGSSASSSIGCSFRDMAQMRLQIEACGYSTTHNPKFQQFNVLGLLPALREIGVLGDKHIPEQYLCGTVNQRIALLQGLIDTDGDVTKEGKVTFNNSNRALMEQVLSLVHSLGVKARITSRHTHYNGVPSQESYRIMFKMAGAARLPRKASRCRALKGNWSRSIDIRRTAERGLVCCLQVANEDGLFMAGRGWVVTHNTKSEFASYLLPAWFLGKYPHKKVIQTAHTAELAVGFGRRVRNLVNQEVYTKIFPGLGLQSDSKAAGRWNTNRGGDYFAIGVGGAVTGKGADLLIIDDPHSEQEATLAETSPEIYDKVYEWYTSGPRQRLQPGGAIVIVMCMTGDTAVLMADGSERFLKDLRVGDFVATFEDGRLTAATVNNWRSSGVDSIYRIQTQSGRILRANRRHPFLVMNEGVLEWTRLSQLRVGDELVATKDVIDRLAQKQNPDCVARAQRESPTTGKIRMLLTGPSDTTENGKEKSVVVRGVALACIAMGCARCIIGKIIGLLVVGGNRQKNVGRIGLKAAMELRLRSMTSWLRSAIIGAMSVGAPLRALIPAPIGAGSCVSTIATTLEKYEVCCVTTATSLSDMERRRMFSNELRRISDFTTDPIVSITPDGVEEVFDVEIDRTENFIANGVVSHNTRWSKRDLTGQVLKAAALRGGDEWEVIEFPAIFENFDPPRPLWPEFWSLELLLALKEELPNSKWMAQYQQNPVSEASAIVKREWWQTWEEENPPYCDFVLQSWDTAFEKSNRSDYSACTTWGVFYQDNPDTGKTDANIILLDAFRDRMEFPALKRKALEQMQDYKPDSIIIEKKASGAPLIYELRAMGIPVQEFTPVKGNDKIARLNAVSDLFASGRVWAPPTSWAEAVIDEVASFPAGEHDDFVDSVSLALMRFRNGGFIRSEMDEPEPVKYFKRNRNAGYY